MLIGQGIPGALYHVPFSKLSDEATTGLKVASTAKGAFRFNPFAYAGRTFTRLARNCKRGRRGTSRRKGERELIIYLFYLSWASQARGYYPPPPEIVGALEVNNAVTLSRARSSVI